MDNRQPSHHDPNTPTNDHNPNVFDDEYAVDNNSDLDFAFVADGFRPSQSNPPVANPTTTNTVPLDHRSSIRHSISENFPPDSKQQPAPVPSRNSTMKGHTPQRSLTMANDGTASQEPDRTQSIYSNAGIGRAPALSHRASVASTSSFATMQRSQSPFQGHSGPSHPYGMYPQGTGIVRSPSVATTSTARAPQRTYSGQGPTHPYAMYPQNVVEDPEETAAPHAQQSFPVGFPGLGQGFHRQIGPDGEEQDIIGPDGHTEQLPPYSRFPEEGPTKASILAVPEEDPFQSPADSASSSRDASNGNIVPMTSIAATQPSPPPPPQPQSSGQSDGSSTLVGSEDPEKSWKDKSWREKRKTKFLCGTVPLWALLVAGGVIVILAAVLGGVIGAFLGHHGEKKGPATVTVVSTASLFDASFLTATPSSLSALPTGKYALPMGIPETESNQCLTESDQTGAWSCTVEGPPLEIEVGTLVSSHSNYGTSLEPLENTTTLQYGSQAPTISEQSLRLVSDLDNPSEGPAWHFQTYYDKIVILRADEFQAGQNLRKRKAQGQDGQGQGPNTPSSSYWQSTPPAAAPSGFELPPQFRHRNEVQKGDTPWYCIWNSTFIEGFIYVNEDTSAAASDAASAAIASATSSGFTTSPSPGQFSSSGPAPTASSTYNGAAATTTWPQSTITTAPESSTTTSFPVERRQDYSELSSDVQWYPRVVKIEERRFAGQGATPYCQKMQLLDNGHMVPISSNGQAIIVTLTEEDPNENSLYATATLTTGSDSSGGNSRRRFVEKRDDDEDGSCHCQWTFS
ncbi:hypothetical protein K490DRAFT_68162 [Saccharata proteae CBS 121410]|uniref:DUF7820 domain-containing protein n=1 Tax=Saccharata proteae CBS 121410 TaxID=1314787 RepID=A0A9P4LSX0_9PEZI|nr:hypothetical protein K490DRAFT_68162 [Saccharata proteae CBS 121410]